MNESVQSTKDVLDVQIPAALEEAAARLRTVKEQRVLNAARQELANSVHVQHKDAPEPQFFPQSIPFYAATEAFNYFRGIYPHFSYKEAALNPTNLRDRTFDWEADIVNFFRDNPSKTEFAGQRDTPIGRSFFLSTPIRLIVNASAVMEPRNKRQRRL